MSFTKVDILTEARNRTGRGTDLTSIDNELKSILLDLASRVPGMVEKSGGVTIAENGISATVPADFVRKRALTDSSYKPLHWVDTLEELLARYSADATKGTPSKWTIFEKKVYVWPAASTQTALTLYYHYEDTSVNSITYPDCAKEACIEGVCKLVELGKSQQAAIPPDAVTHHSFYEQQVAILQTRFGNTPQEVPVDEGKAD